VLLAEAVASVARQTSADWELIVVDDGSNDGSLEWLDEISAREPRIRPLKRPRPPSGAPTCRNVGAQQARGRYLVFLDSDDVLAPHCLSQRARYLDDHPRLYLAVFPMLLFEHEPWDLGLLWNVWHRSPCVESCDLQRFLVGEDPPWQTSMPIWRKAAFQRLGAWDEGASSLQDWELHVRALIASCRYERVAAPPDCCGRRHQGPRISLTAFSPPVLARRIRTLDSIIERLGASAHSETLWAPRLVRLLVRQAERAALRAAPLELVLALLHRARDLSAATSPRWRALEAYLRVQRALAARDTPLLRGGLMRTMRTLRPDWFSSCRTYGRRRLSEPAIAALRRGDQEGAMPGDIDWPLELIDAGRH